MANNIEREIASIMVEDLQVNNVTIDKKVYILSADMKHIFQFTGDKLIPFNELTTKERRGIYKQIISKL